MAARFLSTSVADGIVVGQVAQQLDAHGDLAGEAALGHQDDELFPPFERHQ